LKSKKNKEESLESKFASGYLPQEVIAVFDLCGKSTKRSSVDYITILERGQNDQSPTKFLSEHYLPSANAGHEMFQTVPS
jgi:hypothetical protein